MEIAVAFLVGAFLAFIATNLHLENRIEAYENLARQERERADRAVDRLVTQLAGAAPISVKAAEDFERAKVEQYVEAHELRNLFADEIGDDDEQQIIPAMPERDPRGRHV